jgi:hypothetical protein
VLTIRKAQLEVFQQARIKEFIDDMLAYFANEYPTHYASMGPARTRAFVERSIEAAKRLGIQTRGSVGAYTEIRLIYGENLERAPERQWARNILAHPTLPDHIKVGAVQERLSERTSGRVLVVHREPD